MTALDKQFKLILRRLVIYGLLNEHIGLSSAYVDWSMNVKELEMGLKLRGSDDSGDIIIKTFAGNSA